LSKIIGFQRTLHVVESNYFGLDADFSAGGIGDIVHLERESYNRQTISKATAKGAVSSIFTIASDFT
jgi:hypothetical protein